MFQFVKKKKHKRIFALSRKI